MVTWWQTFKSRMYYENFKREAYKSIGQLIYSSLGDKIINALVDPAKIPIAKNWFLNLLWLVVDTKAKTK